MALGNRERIGKMFEAMAPALDEFITRVLGPDLPEGHTWIQLVALKDAQNGIQGKDYSPLDPQVQLRMLTASIPHQLKKGWYPMNRQLGHVQKGFASELREVRNSWAHKVVLRRRRLPGAGHRGAPHSRHRRGRGHDHHRGTPLGPLAGSGL